jgi:hypothetical protein
MKTKLIYLILTVAAVSFNACKKDDPEVPKLIPTVVTGGAVNVTLSSATVAGTVSSDGNSKITATGIVYSSNVSLPTIVDNKKEITDGQSNFTATLEGLTSGTTYHARAYATNSVGTGYGAVVDFTTGNAAPVASSVSVTGKVEVNKTVSATYTYSDAEGNSEGATVFQWYSATNGAGAGESAIAGATSKTLLITDALNGKFIRVSVTPKASSGTIDGVEVKSLYTTAVGAETVTFTYNGASVTYGTIVSAKTSRKWLDRNLGATQVATNVSDYSAIGDMFQWGRPSDGHQRVTRTNGTDAGATGPTGTTSTTSSADVPPTDKFITNTSLMGDWRNPQNMNLWQGVNGVNNPCPSGWRIATQQEWIDEDFTSIDDAYTKLKLTYSGARDVTNGSFSGTTAGAWYWTSTVDPTDNVYTIQVYLDATSIAMYGNNRGYGVPCRCIKN